MNLNFRYSIIYLLITPMFIFSKSIPVANDNVNIREKPSLNSKIIINLRISQEVTIIKTTDQVINISGKFGKWVKIKTKIYEFEPEPQFVEGWIFDYFLGYENSFKKLNHWEIKSFYYCIGDYCPTYAFSQNGETVYSLFDCEDGNCPTEKSERKCNDKCDKCEDMGYGIKCTKYGHIYRFRNLIKIQYPDGNYDIYYIIKNNNKEKICFILYDGECKSSEKSDLIESK